MKTKKLIELLQQEDPSGGLEVSIGGEDIFFVEALPGYWDGVYQVLVRDWRCEYYSVIGAEYRSDGTKLNIHTLSIEDALLDDPDLTIKVIDTFCEPRMQKTVDRWRAEALEILKEIHDEGLDSFKKEFIPKMLEGNLKVLQPKTSPLGKLNAMWLVKDPEKFEPYKEIKSKGRSYQEKIHNDNQDIMCQGNCRIVIEEEMFIPIERDNYFEWVYSPEK